MSLSSLARSSLSSRRTPVLYNFHHLNRVPVSKQQRRSFSKTALSSFAQDDRRRPMPSDPPSSQSTSQNPPIPRLNIKELFIGAPRSVKIVVITAFWILASIETMFWINVGQRYFSSPPDDGGGGAETLGSVIDDELRKHKIVGQTYQRYNKPEVGKEH